MGAAARTGGKMLHQAYRYVRRYLADNQHRVMSMFDKYDRDKSGYLELNEVVMALRSLMPGLTVAELRGLMAQLHVVDVNEDGRIARSELAAFAGLDPRYVEQLRELEQPNPDAPPSHPRAPEEGGGRGGRWSTPQPHRDGNAAAYRGGDIDEESAAHEQARTWSVAGGAAIDVPTGHETGYPGGVAHLDPGIGLDPDPGLNELDPDPSRPDPEPGRPDPGRHGVDPPAWEDERIRQPRRPTSAANPHASTAEKGRPMSGHRSRRPATATGPGPNRRDSGVTFGANTAHYVRPSSGGTVRGGAGRPPPSAADSAGAADCSASRSAFAGPVDADLMAELEGDDEDGDDEMIVPLGYRDGGHTPRLEEPVPVYERVYRPGSAARGERPVERPPDNVVRHDRPRRSGSARLTEGPKAASSDAQNAKTPVDAVTATAANAHANAPEALFAEIPEGLSAKATLQAAMAARERYDRQLAGAVKAAQDDVLTEVVHLRRSASLAGRFRSNVEALIDRIEASGGVLKKEVEEGFGALRELMAAREKQLLEQAGSVAAGRLGMCKMQRERAAQAEEEMTAALAHGDAALEEADPGAFLRAQKTFEAKVQELRDGGALGVLEETPGSADLALTFDTERIAVEMKRLLTITQAASGTTWEPPPEATGEEEEETETEVDERSGAFEVDHGADERGGTTQTAEGAAEVEAEEGSAEAAGEEKEKATEKMTLPDGPEAEASPASGDVTVVHGEEAEGEDTSAAARVDEDEGVDEAEEKQGAPAKTDGGAEGPAVSSASVEMQRDSALARATAAEASRDEALARAATEAERLRRLVQERDAEVATLRRRLEAADHELTSAKRAVENAQTSHDAQMGALQASHDARVASIEARVEAALRTTEVALGGGAMRPTSSDTRTVETPATTNQRKPGGATTRHRSAAASSGPISARPVTASGGFHPYAGAASSPTRYLSHGTPAFGSSGLQRPEAARKGGADSDRLSRVTPPVRRGEAFADVEVGSPRGARQVVGGGFRRRPESAMDGSRRAREWAETEAAFDVLRRKTPNDIRVSRRSTSSRHGDDAAGSPLRLQAAGHRVNLMF